MIFSIGNHIEQIKKGLKTQTRRNSSRYEIGKSYAIQPGRTKKAIPEGRIMIIKKERENCYETISRRDALAEGVYMPEELEKLYKQIHVSSNNPRNWGENLKNDFCYCLSGMSYMDI